MGWFGGSPLRHQSIRRRELKASWPEGARGQPSVSSHDSPRSLTLRIGSGARLMRLKALASSGEFRSDHAIEPEGTA